MYCVVLALLCARYGGGDGDIICLIFHVYVGAVGAVDGRIHVHCDGSDGGGEGGDGY